VLGTRSLNVKVVGQRSAEGKVAWTATTFTSLPALGFTAGATARAGASAETRWPVLGHAGAIPAVGAGLKVAHPRSTRGGVRRRASPGLCVINGQGSGCEHSGTSRLGAPVASIWAGGAASRAQPAVAADDGLAHLPPAVQLVATAPAAPAPPRAPVVPLTPCRGGRRR
jgi:hypothetical protein